MAVKAATRAFLWRLNISNFKAAYGRYPENSGDKTYTKNFFQIRDHVRDELNMVLGHDGTAGAHVTVTWRWPGGTLEKRYDNKDSDGDTRGQLYLTTATGSSKTTIAPFTPGSASNPGKAIVGDPDLPNPTDATDLLNQILKSGVGGWYLAVALRGEPRALHARMILENPPPGKEAFGLERQPRAIRNAIRAAAPATASLWVDLEIIPRAQKIVRQISDAFGRNPNVLLVGPPGCGKSVALEDIKALYNSTAWFDTERYDAWRTDTHKVFDTAFHPASSYENFVAGVAPKPGVGIQLEVRSGPLINMAQWSRADERDGLLLIDEFNRGPAAAILGDALVLLDKNKRSSSADAGVTISQPHPDRDINVPMEFAAPDPAVHTLVPKDFSLPVGLKILGAFNSSDRSVAPLDAALLRRFSLVRVAPDAAVLAEHLGLTNFDEADVAYLAKPIDQWDATDVRRLAVHLLLRINERLRLVLGEDHELGHALFWGVSSAAERLETAATLAAEFEEKVIGRLRQTLRDKDEQLAVILNVPDRGDDSGDGVASWIDDNSRIGRLVGPKLRIRNLKEDGFEEQVRRLVVAVQDEP